MSEHIETVIPIKGKDLLLDIYAEISTGGSSLSGSTEPPWFSIEITEIYCGKTHVSARLWNYIIDRYGSELVEDFREHYY